MLYTRCPDCETTFRVTEAALQQADGQVRCGRCTHVFDARDSLSDHLGDGDDGAAADLNLGADDEGVAKDTGAPAGDPDSPDAAPAMSSADVAAVLDAPPPPPVWLSGDATTEARRNPLWLAAAGLALLALGAQFVHHNRFALVENGIAGPLLRRVYTIFGSGIEPEWNLGEYELLDWIAVAEPAQSGHANLVIRAELVNSAVRAQPYPLIWLRLLDRWEDTVAARLFTPNEYLVAHEPGPDSMMAAGSSVDMALVLVDPGTDAYGFELAVCVRSKDRVRCDTDATFRD